MVRRNRSLFSLSPPIVITIIYDRNETYLNCSTFFPTHRLDAKVRLVLYYFYDLGHEKRILKQLNDYISSH